MYWPLLSIILILVSLLVTGFITMVLIVPIFGPLSWIFSLIILFVVVNFIKKQIINPNDPKHWESNKNLNKNKKENTFFKDDALDKFKSFFIDFGKKK